MNTYGLYRPLNTFGLSRPGIWLVVVVGTDGSTKRTFYAYGSTEYIVKRIEEAFSASSVTIYEAKAGGGVVIINRYFHAYEGARYYKPYDLQVFQTQGISQYMLVSASKQEFIPKQETTYAASDYYPVFTALLEQEYKI